MDKKKFIAITPFITIGIILIYSWYEMLTVYHYASPIKYVALIIFAVNVIVYFLSFKYGVVLTGILLILATINLAPLFTDVVRWSLMMAGITFPAIDWRTLLLLIYYLVINVGYLRIATRRE